MRTSGDGSILDGASNEFPHTVESVILELRVLTSPSGGGPHRDRHMCQIESHRANGFCSGRNVVIRMSSAHETPLPSGNVLQPSQLPSESTEDRPGELPFSVLFAPSETRRVATSGSRPAFFDDLYLDRVLASILGRDPYELAPLFSLPLETLDGIKYRHEAIRDLRGTPLEGFIEGFAEAMNRIRQYRTLVQHLRFEYSMKGWLLYTVGLYCDAVVGLHEGLASTSVTSRAFTEFRRYLSDYIASAAFTGLRAEVAQVKERLATVRYALTIDGNRIHVSDYGGEADYSSDVAAVFAKFDTRGDSGQPIAFPKSPDMNHVEAAILEMVAKLNTEIFGELDRFCAAHADYLDDVIATFDREVQLYIAYLRYVDRISSTGLSFCYPRVRDDTKSISVSATFDIALADKLVRDEVPVVTNDFFLSGPERIVVVTGPNQGGKTTFARTFGQLHLLGRLGLLVPGTRAELYLFDQLFTHFEKQEDPLSHRGKLEDDLLRIREILDRATDRSIVILNEIFTSTTLDDAVFLSTHVFEQLIRLDALCVCVTFLDELASFDTSVVSMVSTVDSDDPAIRTLKILRQPPDGLAYAEAIADKYRVSYARLTNRLDEQQRSAR
jgi:DNA mismatch repair protein MutS